MAKQSVWSRVSIWPLVTASASAAALTALLLYGMQSARTLQATSTALQRSSELSGEPQVVHSQLSLLQRGLENRTYVGESLRSLAAERKGAEPKLIPRDGLSIVGKRDSRPRMPSSGDL